MHYPWLETRNGNISYLTLTVTVSYIEKEAGQSIELLSKWGGMLKDFIRSLIVSFLADNFL